MAHGNACQINLSTRGKRLYHARTYLYNTLCTHTLKFIYIIYTTLVWACMCVCMAFLTDKIQFNIILTVVVFFFFSIVYLFILFPLSLVSYRPAVDNASAGKRITAKRWNGKSLEFCCELQRRQNREEEGQYFQFRVYNGDRFSRRGPLTNRMSSLCRYRPRHGHCAAVAEELHVRV